MYSNKEPSNKLIEMKNSHIDRRWGQLHALSKESGDSAIKYLFTVNAGGAVAVLAYLGSTSNIGVSVLYVKIALVLFFIGLILAGVYKAYMVHDHESLFEHYQNLVSQYYENEIGWEELIRSDKTKVGNAKTPYILGYGSFFSFIGGCILGAVSVF